MKRTLLPIALTILVAALCACSTVGDGVEGWPHVIDAGDSWIPAPGYTFVSAYNDHNYSVRWEPGKQYSYLHKIKWPHIYASYSEGEWLPDPGYSWTTTDKSGTPIPGELSVRWTPGKSFAYQGHIAWHNITAGAAEGTWFPDPGYSWAHIDSSGRVADYAVAWTPGMGWYSGQKLEHPHVLASDPENIWRPEPGYRWTHVDSAGQTTDWVVAWTPGQLYFDHLGENKWPHVQAAATEGSWTAEPGYEWAHVPPGHNLTVIATSDPRSPSGRERALHQHWMDYLKEIQATNNYPNWSGPPADLFRIIKD